MSNITQVINTDKNMTILKKAVHATDLDQILSTTGPFTLFAPSDAAFKKLQPGIMDNLLMPEKKQDLTSLIYTHVLQGKLNYAELKDGDKLKTVNGKELSVIIKDKIIHIDGATISQGDVKTSNGVIHSLDSVLKN